MKPNSLYKNCFLRGTFNSGNNPFRHFSSQAACDGVYRINLPEFKSKPSIKEEVVGTGVIPACNHPLLPHFLISFRCFKCDKAGIMNIRFKSIRKLEEFSKWKNLNTTIILQTIPNACLVLKFP